MNGASKVKNFVWQPIRLAVSQRACRSRFSTVLEKPRVIAGRPLGQAIDFSGPYSWIPGSRALPAPRKDDVFCIFSTPLDPRFPPRDHSAGTTRRKGLTDGFDQR
jgi:hypothetical protein